MDQFFALVPQFGRKDTYLCIVMTYDMTPFLKQVADHYFKAGDISGRCFIFPNRRSMVFFRKWLSADIAEYAAVADSSPVIAPSMMTVNDLFYKIGGYCAADKVRLLLELYECYSRLNPKAESLDDFIFWGDVILADFNDVDKYLADPSQVFTNVSELKSIQDDFSYLTETQRAALESFISHFNDRTGKLTVDINSENPGIKARFLHIWNILHPLYVSFNKALKDKGIAYEGMVYRDAAQKMKDGFLPEGDYVFVGLNALNECEKTVFRCLKNAGKAEFCWDWCGDMNRDRRNKSSVFMSVNVKEFPQAFEPEGGDDVPSFNVLSVPSSYGQVKHLPSILDKVGYEPDGTGDGSDTALVLPDEGLLIPLLNSIPEHVRDINVTMGYPMSSCRLSVFMGDVARMQLHMRKKGDRWCYYHKHVWNILSSGLMRAVLSSDEMLSCREKVAAVRRDGKYYIPQDDLEGFAVLEKIFNPVVNDPSSADIKQTDEFASYLQDVVSYMAVLLAGEPDMVMELEFAHKYYSCINSLRFKKLPVQPVTLVRLLDTLMSGLTVPFRGEPLKGLQIMGPLETRALDFRNVIIFSCNEGMFPRRNVSSSFVPPELRKAFGMPTYEYQDAIWAYYFYRLVSRAENVWMIYDSRTEGLKRGEESRYIKQLKYHYGVDIGFHTAVAGLKTGTNEDVVINKTDEMMDIIAGMSFSASSLQNYVMCPAKFCYQSVLKLKKDEDVAESLDNAMIGNVYHNLMWALYYGGDAMDPDIPFDKLENRHGAGAGEVSMEYLRSWLEREDDIKKKIRSLMMSELNTDEINGRDLVVLRVIMRYVRETIRKDISLMEKYGIDRIDILGLEKKVYADIHGARFFGVIDRMDSLMPGMVRLVDYKSGSDNPMVIAASDDNADVFVERIFDAEYKVKKDYKAALQFYIYGKMAAQSGLVPDGDHIFNSMYSTSDLFRNIPAVNPLSPRFSELMDNRLKEVLDQIRDRNVPFRMASEPDACRYCDFKMICGR